MPRDFRADENSKRARAKREAALMRNELGRPSSPRIAAAGPVSMAVKLHDPATRAMIDAAIAEGRTRRIPNGR